ncbi:MAG TPA: response regulator transcription factor [Gaiellaceae bacterium]|nr:response regulator transcription factor [Gaiellaceae bacterium]
MASPSPIRILLVEDNDVFREALELLLGMRAEVDVVASIGDGAAVVEAVRTHEPDVVVMDYRLPGLDGIQATLAVRNEFPTVGVVGLTASANARETDALYSAGASSVLTKDRELDEIVDAIKAAAA